jgi:hypothetical protein
MPAPPRNLAVSAESSPKWAYGGIVRLAHHHVARRDRSEHLQIRDEVIVAGHARGALAQHREGAPGHDAGRIERLYFVRQHLIGETHFVENVADGAGVGDGGQPLDQARHDQAHC